jgi:NADH:ubiquinone oxidoreductase subunit 6 (subunit J)
MTVTRAVFIVLSVVSLSGAAGVVLNRNLFRSALFLVLAFVGVAGFYVLLEAELLAMIQLLVYVGAISILIIFAIMLSTRIMSADFRARNEQWLMALIAAVALFGGLVFVIMSVHWPATQASVPAGAVSKLGQALIDVDQFILPFEVASILLLVALVGAVVIAREK